MKNVTAIVISFLRPGFTKACIESLRRTYPEIKIVVGENGHHNPDLAKACKKFDAKYIQLPYDSGVCVARNTLVKNVETEYILVGDDDFYYNEEAKADAMKYFLDRHPEFDLIGGRVTVAGIVQNYQGYIEKTDTHFVSTPIRVEEQEFELDHVSREDGAFRYCPADLTFNYFLARTDKVRQVPWDEQIKVAYEHFTWFFDFKCAGGKVAFTPDAMVVHKPSHVDPEQSDEYSAFRMRKGDKERFFSKYEIKYIIGMNGVKTYAPNHVAETRRNDTKFVDFCITTFERPHALKRLLFSIADNYPMANVYVADQSKVFDRAFYKKLRSELLTAGLHKRVSVTQLPYDCGLSYARNYLVKNTPNKYKLILDDDMVFIGATEIKKFVELMDEFPRVGVVGGMVEQTGVEVHFEFDIEKRGDTLYQVKDKGQWRDHKGIKYKRTGCVLNFALMRGEMFNQIGWDNKLKVTEHMDFYYRMKQSAYQIIYTPDVIIDHPPIQRPEGYKDMRQRKEFFETMLKKHGVKRVKYLNGQIVELAEGGGLKRYIEQPE